MFRSQVMIYTFNYTILPTVSLTMPIQQPPESQYVTMCGALGSPSVSVKPYIIDICGHFSSIEDAAVRAIMQTIGSYYTTRRMSIVAHRKLIDRIQIRIIILSLLESYSAIPLNVEHFLTKSGTVMTRISFVIRSGASITLGSNVEPLVSINDMLKAVPYRSYQQCTPYISLKILLPLKICAPFDEIPSAIPLVTEAVAAATGKFVRRIVQHSYKRSIFNLIEEINVHVMLKGVEEGVTLSG